jgi:hypothetical protein
MAYMKTFTVQKGVDNTELYFKNGKLVAIAEPTMRGWKLLSFPSLRLLGLFQNLYNVIPSIENQEHTTISN